jgi:hypothetical protein
LSEGSEAERVRLAWPNTFVTECSDLKVQITQIEAEIKEVKEEAAKENDPAIKLEAMKQLTALRTHINEIEKQKTFLMQQEGESQLLALLIKSKISLPCMAKSSHAYPSRSLGFQLQLECSC